MERERMAREASLPNMARGGMLRWGGIFAGMITGYVSLMILIGFGLTIWLRIVAAASPRLFTGVLIGGGVWLLAAHAIAAYLGGRTTASTVPYANVVQQRFNALITGRSAPEGSGPRPRTGPSLERAKSELLPVKE